MKIIGLLLSGISKINYGIAMSLRCKIVNSIISKHAFTVEERTRVLTKANRFLGTMSDIDKGAVMANVGVKKVSWADNRSGCHMGDQ